MNRCRSWIRSLHCWAPYRASWAHRRPAPAVKAERTAPAPQREAPQGVAVHNGDPRFVTISGDADGLIVSMTEQRASLEDIVAPVACSATISFCESGICHRSGCTYLIPIRPRELRKLVGGKAREDLIVANWPDIFRCAATMTAGKIRPSQLLRSLLTHDKTTLQLRFVKLVVLNGPFSLLSDPGYGHAAACSDRS
jgi:hypothetical protein